MQELVRIVEMLPLVPPVVAISVAVTAVAAAITVWVRRR
jgi:hypothetical protein